MEDYGLQLLKKQSVGIFGNSKTSDPQDWIEVKVSNAPDYQDLENHDQLNNLGECKEIIR